jgi:hypothetical protein
VVGAEVNYRRHLPLWPFADIATRSDRPERLEQYAVRQKNRVKRLLLNGFPERLGSGRTSALEPDAVA